MNRQVIVSLTVLVILVGCGTPEEFGVAGRITLDGEPLSGATVTFMPDDAELTPGMARTDVHGMYTAEISSDQRGLAIGTYTVRISTFDEGDLETDPPLLPVNERVPSKYNYDSNLKVEVKPEMNVFDFALDAKGKIEE